MLHRALAILLSILVLTGLGHAQPDLSVNNVILPASGAVTAGVSFQITRDISNIGSVPVSSFIYDVRLSTDTNIQVTDPVIATVTSSNFGIVPVNITLPANFTSGNYYVAVIVGAATGELNPNNNLRVSTSTLAVFPGAPDLNAVAVSGPAMASPGQSINVTRDVSNLGGVLQSGPFTYQIRLSSDQTIDASDPLLLQISSTTLGPLAVNVTIPSNQALGSYWLGLVLGTYPGETVTNNSIVVSTSPLVLVNAAPTISNVTANTGTVFGGETVTISGTNFDASATVDFGTTASPMVTFINTTTVMAVVPASPGQLEGTVDVTVTTTAGSGTATAAYNYGHPYPGSNEDLQLLVGVSALPDALPRKTAVPGDTIIMHMSSPMGTFYNLGAVLIAQIYPTGGAQPVPIPGFPEVWIDTFGAIVVLDGNKPTPFGAIVYAPGGLSVPFYYPGGLSGFTGRAQAFCVTNTAANGLFATSDALEVQY